MNKKRKIFLGLDDTAGIFTSLKKGFNELGIEADFYSYSRHAFGYKTDKIIKYSTNSLVRKFQKVFLITKLIFKYKYFIFNSSGTLLPNCKDIKLFKMFGKKTMIIFTGCDIRLPEKVAGFKWNSCAVCTDEYKKFVGCVLSEKPGKIDKLENSFDIRVSPEEASGSLNKKFYSTLFPSNINKFSTNYSNPNKKLKIVHSPSNSTYKGTKYIDKAINKLKNEFDFEYRVISNVTIEELYKEIESCDLVIDQMLVGFYGLVSIESMAMGKPVVCYIRGDLWEKIKDDCPIYNANPDNLYEVLKSILQNPWQLFETQKRSRAYAEKYHDARKIAQEYYEIFEKTN